MYRTNFFRRSLFHLFAAEPLSLALSSFPSYAITIYFSPLILLASSLLRPLSLSRILLPLSIARSLNSSSMHSLPPNLSLPPFSTLPLLFPPFSLPKSCSRSLVHLSCPFLYFPFSLFPSLSLLTFIIHTFPPLVIALIFSCSLSPALHLSIFSLSSILSATLSPNTKSSPLIEILPCPFSLNFPNSLFNLSTTVRL